ncbi:MAG: phenylalanine--tRNA ligase subunit alpha, partial [Patescibacteria group bacterium]|nr:phenylalanine--tRNA ligase subunit alpha [Patescibacteria group bacterium]
MQQEAYSLFSELGFEITTGPELETLWYNFDALNVPKDHPARDMQDTFYIKKSNDNTSSEIRFERSSDLLAEDSDGRGQTISNPTSDSAYVLRTHATNVTARTLERVAKDNVSELASISIGKVFRNEATDITHEMQFFQIDGCMVGPDVNLSYMKGVLVEFYKKVLGPEVEIEFRPSFFPFTEPSVEVHAKFQGRWLEMMGGGMLHPNVLRNAGLDPEKVQGFAFGGGL